MSTFNQVKARLEVFMFIPNLIGYARFGLLFLSCYYAFSKNPDHALYFPICYGVS